MLNNTINESDTLTDIDEQIKFLKNEGLIIPSDHENELRHIIINYGFNRLFTAYSKAFLKNNKTFIKNLEITNIISLYYFDRNFSNILNKYLGLFEHKLTANIINQVNIEVPDYTKQLDYLYPNQKSRTKLLKYIKQDFESGTLYLAPFIKENIYPAWIVANTGTLSEKIILLNRLKNYNNIVKNFYLNNIEDLKSIAFNFLRIVRNETAHFERMIKFYVMFDIDSKFNNLMQDFLKTYLPTNVFDMIDKWFNITQTNQYNTFIMVIILCHLLSKTQSKCFIVELEDLFKQGIKNENIDFDFEKDILFAKNILNWPPNWKDIFTTMINQKIIIT